MLKSTCSEFSLNLPINTTLKEALYFIKVQNIHTADSEVERNP